MRARLLFFLTVLYLWHYDLAAQQFPNPALLCTGTNSTGTGTLTTNSQDLHWLASCTGSLGTYTPAVVVGNQTGWSASSYSNSTWITYPKTCSATPADHSCMNLLLSEYYLTTISLPSLACGQSVSTASAYCLSLDFMADNVVHEIFVNGVSCYSTTVTNPAGNWGFLINNKITVTLCNNWIAGTNTIIVHTKSGAELTGGLSGFLAQVNQTVNTTVGQPVMATSIQTNALCYGGNGAASVTATGGLGAYTYSWAPTGGTTNVANGLPADSYSCIITSSGQCTTIKTISIAQPFQQTVNITASSPTACTGGSIVLTAQSLGGVPGYSYTWGSAQGSVLTVQSPTAGTVIYTVGVTDFNNCPATRSTSVTFIAPPVISASSSNLCMGGSATITANGASTYTWLPPGSTGSLLTVSPTVNTNYTVSGSSQGCTGQTVIILSVSPLPTVAISPPSASVCLGTGQVLTALMSGGTSPYTYTWIAGSHSSTHNAIAFTPGSHSFSLAATDIKGCRNSATTSVFFYNGVTLSASQPTICPGDTAMLIASGANTYTWSPQLQGGSSIAVSPTTTSVYTLSGTSVNGCTANITPTVQVHPYPVLSFNTNSITCAHLGEATVTAQGPSTFNFSWTPTSQTGSVATNLFPGMYTVSVLDNNTNCLFKPTVKFDPLIPLTATVNPIDSLKCFGATSASASVILAGGSSTQNYLWSSISGNQTNSLALNLSAGVHTIDVTDALTFCTVTKTFVVNQPPQLAISFAASSPSTCVGGAVTLSAQVNGGTYPYSYSWTPSAVSLTLQVSQVAAGTSVHQFLASDSYSCTASKTISIDHVPYPVVSVSDVSLCPLQPGVLTATGATSYQWNTLAVGAALPVSLQTSTGFTVTGTTAACSTTASALVSIKPAPVPAPISNSPLCERDTLRLASAASGTFAWTGPQQLSSSQQSINIPGVVPSHSGVYDLTVTAANGCTASASIPVVVNPAPVAGIWGATVCAGQAFNIQAGNLTAISYQWTGPSSYSSSLQSNTVTNADTTMSGQYVVLLTYTNTGCTNTLAANVLVKNPVPVQVAANTPLCPGEVLVLNTSGSAVWWTGPGVISNQSTVVVGAVKVSAQYSLNVQQGPCSVDTTIDVIVHPRTQVAISGDSLQFFCEGSNMQLVGAASPAASTYTWLGATMQPVHISVLDLSPAPASVSGTYSLVISDINGCTGYDIVHVTVRPLPIVTATGDTVCIGMPAELHAMGGITYHWSGPGGFTESTQSVLFPVAQFTNSGIYSVQAADSNQCVSTATAALIAEAFPLPVPQITSFPLKACINSDVQLKGSGGVNYQWQGPNSFMSPDATAMLVIRDSSAAGVYTLTVTDANKCAGSTTIQLAIFALPRVPLSLSSNFQCVPFCSDLLFDQSINATGPLHDIKILIEDAQADTNLVRRCFSVAGEHAIKVFYTDSNNCSNTSSVTVVGFAKPDAVFSFRPAEPKVNVDLVQFYNHSECYTCAATWFFGPRSDTSFTREPVYTFPEAGSHAVTLLMTSREGCTDTLTMPVHVDDEFTLYVPNSFSPNGDGLNDVFEAKGQGIDKFSIQVFDRWGELIFSSESIYEGWDGNFRGRKCKPDIYTWVIRAEASHLSKSFNGFINLLN